MTKIKTIVILTDRTRKILNDILDVARSIPSKKFDMNHWMRDKGCGTTGCMIGWAILRNKIPHVSFTKFGADELLISDGYNDIAKKIGISEPHFIRLFSIGSYAQPTKHNAIRRLESYLKNPNHSRFKD